MSVFWLKSTVESRRLLAAMIRSRVVLRAEFTCDPVAIRMEQLYHLNKTSRPVLEQPTPERVTPAANCERKSESDRKSATDAGPAAVEESPANLRTQDAADDQTTPEVRPEVAALHVVIAFHDICDRHLTSDCPAQRHSPCGGSHGCSICASPRHLVIRRIGRLHSRRAGRESTSICAPTRASPATMTFQ